MNTTEHIVTILIKHAVPMANANAVRIVAQCIGAKETAVIKYPGTKTCAWTHGAIKYGGHDIGVTSNGFSNHTQCFVLPRTVLTDVSI